MNLKSMKEYLEKANVKFEHGLTDGEFEKIERTFNFKFPPDLREFLAYALPVSESFPDWRSASTNHLRSRLSWPFDSMCFDIEHGSFWHPDWGTPPESLEEAYEVARKAVQKAPKLIPVCSHRYIPETPSEAGNPIISVYQTDIIYYGTDLENYLLNEFHENHNEGSKIFSDKWHKSGLREVEFWNDIIDGVNAAFDHIT